MRGAIETIKRDLPVITWEQKRDITARFGLEPLGAVKVPAEPWLRGQQEISGDYLMVPAWRGIERFAHLG